VILVFTLVFFISAITNPVQDVVEFIADYEAKYGTEHPVFYQVTKYSLSKVICPLKYM